MEIKESKQTKSKEMSNPTALITENLCSYLLEKPRLFPDVNIPKKATNFIHTHREKLKVQGEFSFPCRSDLWNNCCKETGHKLRNIAFDMFKDERLDVSINARQRFLKTASSWAFPIERIKIDNERCFLYLQRHAVMTMLLQQVLKNNDTNAYGMLEKNPKQRIFFSRINQTVDEIEELTFYRAKLLEDILRRVFEYSKWTMVTEEDVEEAKQGKGESILHLQVTSAARGPPINSVVIPSSKLSAATIRCGIVIDPITGKLTKLKTREYLNCRSNDMCLMAMHKYGVRVRDDTRFSTLMSRLGAAAVTVDLMEVRFSSPVQIIRSGKGSTKGAAFILYNSARLESLLRRFDEKVENGDYEGLPPLDCIDFALLDEEEEWQLVFCYIFAFPNLIESCLEQVQKGICAVHTIVRFLGDFAALFSVYYRRIRILTQETRQHLMPYVYARIYLAKAVREILNKALALLDIEPVHFM